MPAGRKPKPTALKEIQGSRIRNRRNEPKPGGIPTCPSGLDKEAKKEWRRVSRELIATGVLTSVDRAILAAYCKAWSIWQQATKEFEQLRQTAAAEGKSNLLFRTKTGYVAQQPLLGIINSSAEQMRRLGAELGLSPSSRARLSVEPKAKETDALSTFFAALGGDSDPMKDEPSTPVCADSD
ncbi:MAG TPA: phage terminase small subunit P27 family [Terracidiphilus sp.]|nr:phage terminase small subunit P27 family [Terracidiphilus sp.]